MPAIGINNALSEAFSCTFHLLTFKAILLWADMLPQLLPFVTIRGVIGRVFLFFLFFFNNSAWESTDGCEVTLPFAILRCEVTLPFAILIWKSLEPCKRETQLHLPASTHPPRLPPSIKPRTFFFCSFPTPVSPDKTITPITM